MNTEKDFSILHANDKGLIPKKTWITPEIIDLDVNETNFGSNTLPSDNNFITS